MDLEMFASDSVDSVETRAVRNSRLIPMRLVLVMTVYFSSVSSFLAKSCSFNNAVISSALHSRW